MFFHRELIEGVAAAALVFDGTVLDRLLSAAGIDRPGIDGDDPAHSLGFNVHSVGRPQRTGDDVGIDDSVSVERRRPVLNRPADRSTGPKGSDGPRIVCLEFLNSLDADLTLHRLIPSMATQIAGGSIDFLTNLLRRSIVLQILGEVIIFYAILIRINDVINEIPSPTIEENTEDPTGISDEANSTIMSA